MSEKAYVNNSGHKDQIREEWINQIYSLAEANGLDVNKNGISVITFPAEEMQDLLLFHDRGLIKFEDTQTGAKNVVKGRVVCFEKNSKVHRYLKSRLVNATVERDFEKYLINNIKGFARGKINVFPADCVNLDYDGNISKLDIPIDMVFDTICRMQAIHKHSFCLFITWPLPFKIEDDEPTHINSLKKIIYDNLKDPNAENFSKVFNNDFDNIEGLDYFRLSIIGMSKWLCRKTSTHGYQLDSCTHYKYGEKGRQPMLSCMYQIKYVGEEIATPTLYSQDVPKALNEILILKD